MPKHEKIKTIVAPLAEIRSQQILIKAHLDAIENKVVIFFQKEEQNIRCYNNESSITLILVNLFFKQILKRVLILIAFKMKFN